MSGTMVPRSPGRGGHPFRQRLLVGLIGALIALAAAWLALVIVTRIDELFFPGNRINVGGLAALPGVDDSKAEGPKERINILVLGLDRRPHEGEAPTRTDTMFVLTIDPATKTAGILGIPRDLWVKIPYRDGSGHFEGKVNSAFVTGATQDYPGGGPGLAMRVVEENLGIPIRHYVVIDFEAFVRVVDDLGGIEVDVPEEIYDPEYSRTELPGDYYPLHFEPGRQHMDGQTALDYARTRYGSSDLDRIHRQQLIIFAVIDKALSLNLIPKATELWARYKDAIVTDINDLQIPGFAALAGQIPPEQIFPVSLEPAVVGAFIGDQSVLLADEEIVQQIVQALFSDRQSLEETAQILEEAAQIEVQNGSGSDGLAAQVVDYLAEIGFPLASLTTADAADGRDHPQTEIIDFAGKDYTRQRLAALLDVPLERVRRAGPDDAALRTSEADIVVILGADAQPERFATDSSSGG